MDKGKLLIIADGACNTGFATVTHNLVLNLRDKWDIDVLAINYMGDPHYMQQYARFWNPRAKFIDDLYGVTRVKEFIDRVDAVLVVNDIWVAMNYGESLKEFTGNKVLYTPIDAPNIKSNLSKNVDAIFDQIVAYTEFGKNELKGINNVIVIPHGIDLTHFTPVNKTESKEMLGINPDDFVVGFVDRNQIRKRLDLAITYFAEWVHKYDVPNAKLHVHAAFPDVGYDFVQIADSLGISDRIIRSFDTNIPVEYMKYIYSAHDVKLSTTMGEGWGLTNMEAMACQTACIVPRYSALAEWANGGVHYTEVSSIPFYSDHGVNTRMGIPTPESTVEALQKMYTDTQYRNSVALAGYELVKQDKFNWKNIAQQFDTVLRGSDETNTK